MSDMDGDEFWVAVALKARIERGAAIAARAILRVNMVVSDLVDCVFGVRRRERMVRVRGE